MPLITIFSLSSAIILFNTSPFPPVQFGAVQPHVSELQYLLWFPFPPVMLGVHAALPDVQSKSQYGVPV
jgi:hypothetical protein